MSPCCLVCVLHICCYSTRARTRAPTAVRVCVERASSMSCTAGPGVLSLAALSGVAGSALPHISISMAAHRMQHANVAESRGRPVKKSRQLAGTVPSWTPYRLYILYNEGKAFSPLPVHRRFAIAWRPFRPSRPSAGRRSRPRARPDPPDASPGPRPSIKSPIVLALLLVTICVLSNLTVLRLSRHGPWRPGLQSA